MKKGLHDHEKELFRTAHFHGQQYLKVLNLENDEIQKLRGIRYKLFEMY